MKDKLTAEEVQQRIADRVGVDPETLDEAVLREAGCWAHVAVLPEAFNERVSYLGDVLVQMLCKSKPKDERLRRAVGQLCQALSYMTNSTSWKDGVLHDFDAAELKRKLQHFTRER